MYSAVDTPKILPHGALKGFDFFSVNRSMEMMEGK